MRFLGASFNTHYRETVRKATQIQANPLKLKRNDMGQSKPKLLYITNVCSALTYSAIFSLLLKANEKPLKKCTKIILSTKDSRPARLQILCLPELLYFMNNLSKQHSLKITDRLHSPHHLLPPKHVGAWSRRAKNSPPYLIPGTLLKLCEHFFIV